jgi:hypothetical protein
MVSEIERRPRGKQAKFFSIPNLKSETRNLEPETPEHSAIASDPLPR